MSHSATQRACSEGRLFKSMAIMLRPEEEQPFRAFAHAVLDEVQPETQLEYHFCNQLIFAQWNLNRIGAEESRLIAFANHPFDGRGEGRQLKAMLESRHRYEATQQNALRELRELQTQRAARGESGPEPPPLAVPAPGRLRGADQAGGGVEPRAAAAIRMPSAATAAVSALKIIEPRETGSQPASAAAERSRESQPPSGPTRMDACGSGEDN